jgi:hypothetical protein
MEEMAENISIGPCYHNADSVDLCVLCTFTGRCAFAFKRTLYQRMNRYPSPQPFSATQHLQPSSLIKKHDSTIEVFSDPLANDISHFRSCPRWHRLFFEQRRTTLASGFCAEKI